MKTTVLFSLLGLAAFGAAPAHAQSQEVGRVLSSTPVIQQVAVPRQVCTTQPVAIEQPRSGAGAVMGAIAGGAVGNQIGSGGGRALATMAGLVGGAMLGNSIEGSTATVQNQQQCTTQTFYENRTSSWNVTYEYAGRQYTVQMPYDPGPTIRLQVTPVAAATEPAPQMAPGQAQYAAPATYAAPVTYAPPVTYVAPVYYAAPYPLYRPYYPSVSLNLGYVHRGGHSHGHGHGHGHWR